MIALSRGVSRQSGFGIHFAFWALGLSIPQTLVGGSAGTVGSVRSGSTVSLSELPRRRFHRADRAGDEIALLPSSEAVAHGLARLACPDEGQRGDVDSFAGRYLRVVEDLRLGSIEVCHRLVGGEAGGVVIVGRVTELPHVAERFRENLGLDGELRPVSLEFPMRPGMAEAGKRGTRLPWPPRRWVCQ